MECPLSPKSLYPVRAVGSLSAKRIHTVSVSCQPSSMVPTSRLRPPDTDRARSGRRRFLLGEDSSEWCGQVRGNEEIWILLAQDGLVAVLKQMPGAVMPTVEMDRIACQQPPHDHRNRHGSRPNKQMEMVGNECPGKTACGGLRQNGSKPFDKMIPVGIIKEDPPPLNSTTYDVVQCTRCVNASLSCHGKDRIKNKKR